MDFDSLAERAKGAFTGQTAGIPNVVLIVGGVAAFYFLTRGGKRATGDAANTYPEPALQLQPVAVEPAPPTVSEPPDTGTHCVPPTQGCPPGTVWDAALCYCKATTSQPPSNPPPTGDPPPSGNGPSLPPGAPEGAVCWPPKEPWDLSQYGFPGYTWGAPFDCNNLGQYRKGNVQYKHTRLVGTAQSLGEALALASADAGNNP